MITLTVARHVDAANSSNVTYGVEIGLQPGGDNVAAASCLAAPSLASTPQRFTVDVAGHVASGFNHYVRVFVSDSHGLTTTLTTSLLVDTSPPVFLATPAIVSTPYCAMAVVSGSPSAGSATRACSKLFLSHNRALSTPGASRITVERASPTTSDAGYGATVALCWQRDVNISAAVIATAVPRVTSTGYGFVDAIQNMTFTTRLQRYIPSSSASWTDVASVFPSTSSASGLVQEVAVTLQSGVYRLQTTAADGAGLNSTGICEQQLVVGT